MPFLTPAERRVVAHLRTGGTIAPPRAQCRSYTLLHPVRPTLPGFLPDPPRPAGRVDASAVAGMVARGYLTPAHALVEAALPVPARHLAARLLARMDLSHDPATR